ncbi:putative nucleic-acid-binding protein [Caldicellulosiruptor bescii]|uniref:Nucleic-acid-binding protein contains PIN domain-like protein n=2 Tax=Caldicellulosiruptor bescii TaxID=31899 RepID=B9MNZ0_CALBD|nr:PIN domain-containing protein [Caldicellulosiruptor bescii]ACM61549.1 nucleic-acid-binding protein contains PIN domain-like protein [Caldicellulosiruptor bescii DSM 6725]PBC88639.1 putative nucleic-acid-binding protein [Caldicellulosiruptor bescii]PBC91880.1 putative nucleic-acid-binding protein [Caldicellulosiruptor bescii]PBD02709.1 putative nucleic-acid-binding protein [Caldicellulosiruptor bescii]PBD07674.1 putative nucleic-acid-binding protein [Caldicellulosiruptor bescii]
MKKVWIDANVILRFLLQDHQEFFQKAQKITLEAEQGKLKLLVAPITIAEVVWTLESFYKIPRKEIADILSAFICSDGIEAEEGDVVLFALKSYKESNVDFIDAYLSHHITKSGNNKIFTFDKKHFSRLDVEILSMD